jgi:ornithine--oxo-acid transaminase
MSLFGPGSHGSTFGGSPLSSCLGLASLHATELEDLPAQAREKGPRVEARLRKIASRAPRLREIRARGMMFGIEVDQRGPDAHAFALRLWELGLVLKDTHQWTLRFTPPIVSSMADLGVALDILERAFTEDSALNRVSEPAGSPAPAAGEPRESAHW